MSSPIFMDDIKVDESIYPKSKVLPFFEKKKSSRANLHFQVLVVVRANRKVDQRNRRKNQYIVKSSQVCS